MNDVDAAVARHFGERSPALKALALTFVAGEMASSPPTELEVPGDFDNGFFAYLTCQAVLGLAAGYHTIPVGRLLATAERIIAEKAATQQDLEAAAKAAGRIITHARTLQRAALQGDVAAANYARRKIAGATLRAWASLLPAEVPA